jgi:hypothetical protein
MDSKNNAELVLLARGGNRDAYGELIRRYQHQIWGLAAILLDDRFEAEDVTQEAFLPAWLNLDLLSDPAKFAPWLRRIVAGKHGPFAGDAGAPEIAADAGFLCWRISSGIGPGHGRRVRRTDGW